ncbi:MAG TPA: manganese efflux pump MntP family protein [Coleofasciculaceae cyanobacterium]
MDIFTTASLGLGLSADAFAVAVSSGLSMKYARWYKALKIALFFGAFQMLMPVLGWGLSLTWRSAIEAYDQWIAWGLLCLIGGKTIYEALKPDDDAAGADRPDERACNPADTQMLTGLAIATSIDALAAGVGLTAVQTPILQIAGTIGGITFAVCLAGVFLGKAFGRQLYSHVGKVEVLGGLILILLGFKMLLVDS